VFSPSPIFFPVSEQNNTNGAVVKDNIIDGQSPMQLPEPSPGFLMRNNSNPIGLPKIEKNNHQTENQQNEYQVVASPLLAHANSAVQDILQKEIKREESNTTMNK